MATRVAGEQYYKIDGQLHELKRQIRQKEGYPFDPDQLIAVLQDCIEGKLWYKKDLVHGLFTPILAQIVRVRELNAEYGWGFTDEDFTAVKKTLPKWPDGKLVSVALVPYLPEKDGMGGVDRTFQELWKVTASMQQANWRWSGYDRVGQNALRLRNGIEHPAKSKPVLRWEVIGLNCNRNCKPIQTRNSESSPHAGILAAAMLHPEWIKVMDGDSVPYVWAPGYEVNVSIENKWQHVPDLIFIRDESRVELDCSWCSYCNCSWSVPSFILE